MFLMGGINEKYAQKCFMAGAAEDLLPWTVLLQPRKSVKFDSILESNEGDEIWEFQSG
ncbi:hypothetical protein HNR46_003199 [Haloferula luteola]|uniref:Uncharacterized protein n=1 Tax=Haloferula luteola TaxID=595692 RepID=A0A840VGK0_9BACT|nr:hypothetical protein [Haloferula luteola]